METVRRELGAGRKTCDGAVGRGGEKLEQAVRLEQANSSSRRTCDLASMRKNGKAKAKSKAKSKAKANLQDLRDGLDEMAGCGALGAGCGQIERVSLGAGEWAQEQRQKRGKLEQAKRS